MANIKFTDTLEVTASHGRLAKAAQIYDDQQKSTQAALNRKFIDQIGTVDVTFFESGNKYSDIAAEMLETFAGTKGYFFTNGANWNIDDSFLPSGTLFYVYTELDEGIENETCFWDYVRVLGCDPSSLIDRISALEARLKV